MIDRTKSPPSVPPTALWSTKAKQLHPLHHVCAYQGSFPPQLPAYFLDRYPGIVLDPFCGRGTVLLEAALRGRTTHGFDLSPLAIALSEVKLRCAGLEAVLGEISRLDLSASAPDPPTEIAPFYHPNTWREIWNLRAAKRSAALTALACGKLHGHSPGFFSAFTFNVISVRGTSLRRAQAKHGTKPEYRDVKKCLARAATKFIPSEGIAGHGIVQLADARHLPLPRESVDLVITSPPFLDTIDYEDVNWLRLWFLGSEGLGPERADRIRNRDDYVTFLRACLVELARVLTPRGKIVFEVGPVKRELRLSDLVLEAARGVLLVEGMVRHSFAAAGVPKISRAMSGTGAKTTTMENHCILLTGLALETPSGGRF